ncbi:MAG: MFS transporter [Anaerolineae bacterium]
MPVRSEKEIAAEIERNYRWNFAVNLIDGSLFWSGLTFISSATLLPLFVSKLTSSPLLIGLVAVIAQGGWFLPQLLTAHWVERLPRRKPIAVHLGLPLERLPLWLVAASPLLATCSPTMALILFFASYTWHNVGAGLIATSWQDLLARCFPVNRRGRFWGTTTFVGSSLGIAGAGLSAWLLNRFPFPTNFAYVFSLAATFITLGWFLVILTREPAMPMDNTQQTHRQFLANLSDLLRRDVNFRRFLIARSAMTLGGMGTGFLTVSAVRQWQIPDSTAGLYTAIYLLGQTASNLILGLVADRYGHKLPLELGALASALAFTFAWLAPLAHWYYPVFALLGLNTSTVFVSGLLAPLEFATPQRRPTYVGLTSTTIGLITVVAPLLGAWLAGIDYALLFAVSAGISLTAFVALHWWVREPRKAVYSNNQEH